MKSGNLPIALFTAAAIGALHALVVAPSFWFVIDTHLQTLPWLLRHVSQGLPFRSAVLLLDSTINILIAVPAAYFICLLRPRKLSVYLPLAVVPSLIWTYRLVLLQPSEVDLSVPLIHGALLFVLAIPVAASFTRRIIENVK